MAQPITNYAEDTAPKQVECKNYFGKMIEHGALYNMQNLLDTLGKLITNSKKTT